MVVKAKNTPHFLWNDIWVSDVTTSSLSQVIYWWFENPVYLFLVRNLIGVPVITSNHFPTEIYNVAKFVAEAGMVEYGRNEHGHQSF